MQNPARWAKSLVYATYFAFTVISTLSVAADDLESIPGIADTAGAYLDLGTYRPARLIVYETDSGEVAAATFYEAGTCTFGYDPDRGSRLCPLPWTASDQTLASNWSHRPVRWANERTRAAILDAGFRSKQGDYANGCLVDSLLTYEHVARTDRNANWEGIFILLRGATELGGGHAVCIYLVGTVGWVYDPIGRQVSCLGPIDLQSSATIARKLDPEATGGWLEERDLAWLRRHGHALSQTDNR